MEKIIFIVGHLIVEMRFQETNIQYGCKKIIDGPEITLGGDAYRQAIYCKNIGINVILLGNVGDDYYGKLIQKALKMAGISTSYIKEIHNKNTGLSIEICSQNNQIKRYLSLGANMNDSEFKIPIDYYLHLCNAVIVNKLCNFNLRRQILQAAKTNSIPSIYVRSGFPDEEERNLPIEYLFLDFSEEENVPISKLDIKSYSVQKAIFIRKKNEIIALDPTGEECYRTSKEAPLNTNSIISGIIIKLDPRTKLNDALSFERLFAC